MLMSVVARCLKRRSDSRCCFRIVPHHVLRVIMFTSTGDAFLVDFAQMSYAALVRPRPRTLSVHRRPGQEGRL